MRSHRCNAHNVLQLHARFVVLLAGLCITLDMVRAVFDFVATCELIDILLYRPCHSIILSILLQGLNSIQLFSGQYCSAAASNVLVMCEQQSAFAFTGM